MKNIMAIIMALFSGALVEIAIAQEQASEAEKDKAKNDVEILIDGPKHDIKPPPS